jgi:hypothetical protein
MFSNTYKTEFGDWAKIYGVWKFFPEFLPDEGTENCPPASPHATMDGKDDEKSVLEQYAYQKTAFLQQAPMALPVYSETEAPLAIQVDPMHCEPTDPKSSVEKANQEAALGSALERLHMERQTRVSPPIHSPDWVKEKGVKLANGEKVNTEEQSEPEEQPYTIPQALALIFKRHHIASQEQLFDWCHEEGSPKGQLKTLYLRVKEIAPQHYERIAKPNATIQGTLQKYLTGYKYYSLEAAIRAGL